MYLAFHNELIFSRPSFHFPDTSFATSLIITRKVILMDKDLTYKVTAYNKYPIASTAVPINTAVLYDVAAFSLVPRLTKTLVIA